MKDKRYALASVKAVEDDDSPNGSFHVILSTPEVDRDGESIETRAFEPLPDHITFDVDHGMSTQTTVGSGTPTYEADGLLHVRGTYSSIPRAQEVRTLVREGHIRTTSVAYMNATYEQKDGVPTVTRAELLNGAFVPIPSNRGAAVLTSKAYAERLAAAGPVLEAEGTKATKAQRTQQIHDLAAANGASCELKSVGARVDVKVPGFSAQDAAVELERVVREVHGGDRRWTWVRDYGDDWVVFHVDGMDPTGLFRQAFSVEGNKITLDGEAEAVRSRTVYEAIESTTEDAPKSAAAQAATSSASAVTRARLALGEAALALSAR